MVTKKPWRVIDYQKVDEGASQAAFEAQLPAGTYEMERMPWMTKDGRNITCLVLKGTRVGAAEGYLQDWTGSEWGDFQITICEAEFIEFVEEEEAPPPVGPLAPL